MNVHIADNALVLNHLSLPTVPPILHLPSSEAIGDILQSANLDESRLKGTKNQSSLMVSTKAVKPRRPIGRPCGSGRQHEHVLIGNQGIVKEWKAPGRPKK